MLAIHREAGRGVIHGLRQKPAEIDGVGRRQPHMLAKPVVCKRLLHQSLASSTSIPPPIDVHHGDGVQEIFANELLTDPVDFQPDAEGADGPGSNGSSDASSPRRTRSASSKRR